MVHVCDQCTTYKEDTRVSKEISLEDCLKLCNETSECLGVSVGRVGTNYQGDCWQTTELADNGWAKPDSNPYHDTWRKGSNVSRIITHYLCCRLFYIHY